MNITAPKDVYGIILAGGSGTRFWPVSRQLLPKQLCPIAATDRTMIEVTLDRLDGFIPPENRIVITHAQQIDKTQDICGDKAGHYLAEPDRRDTANAIALGAEYIKRVSGNPQAIMVSLHSDHVIETAADFRSDLETALEGAANGKLVLIGAPPSRPDTGFGYIELADKEVFPRHFDVQSFKEKPDLATAQQYLEQGNFLWNTGLFCWRVDVILDELRERLPATVNALENLAPGSAADLADSQQLAPVYRELPKISIDHAVLEVSRNVVALRGTFQWRDIGSWMALWDYVNKDPQGNCIVGKGLCHDTKTSYIAGNGRKFIAAVGVENLAIVDTEDALLVCDLAASQSVKEVVKWLEENGQADLV